MKIGFYKDGLKVNSKKFNPLNVAFKGHKLETDKEYKPLEASEVLETFRSISGQRNTRQDKINALKQMIDKMNM
ncbi:hypothetical protein [Abyssisolibacter fermentans]|uniref:hypothetical protein n=1 Tax=Abyssisolibacter fermentans TaxID=1766203 RepID=UPI00082A0490|nr:hypothetical protein [Abyssisolibacter fermentans]